VAAASGDGGVNGSKCPPQISDSSGSTIHFADPASGARSTHPRHQLMNPIRFTDVTYIFTYRSSGLVPRYDCFHRCDEGFSTNKNFVAARTAGGGVGSGGGVSLTFRNEYFWFGSGETAGAAVGISVRRREASVFRLPPGVRGAGRGVEGSVWIGRTAEAGALTGAIAGGPGEDGVLGPGAGAGARVAAGLGDAVGRARAMTVGGTRTAAAATVSGITVGAVAGRGAGLTASCAAVGMGFGAWEATGAGVGLGGAVGAKCARTCRMRGCGAAARGLAFGRGRETTRACGTASRVMLTSAAPAIVSGDCHSSADLTSENKKYAINAWIASEATKPAVIL
jgi:hypothetical protein